MQDPEQIPRQRGDGRPTVSVIVPTHHRPTLLIETLRTVLHQSVRDLEVIVVFDGDDPDAQRRVDELGDARLRSVVHPQARGVSAARNAGAGVATGEWLAFCDDDDLWAPAKLARQLGALTADRSAGWCTVSEVRLFDGGRLGPVVHCVPAPELPAALRSANVVPAGGSGVVVRRQLFLDVGGFDEELAMFADWDMWLRLAAASSVTVVREPLVAYRDHAAAMSRDLAGVERELARMEHKHAVVDGRPSLDVTRVREWSFERVLAHPERAARLGALRSLWREHRPPVMWTVRAFGRVLAPRPIVRSIRVAQVRRHHRGSTFGWVPADAAAPRAGPSSPA